MRTKNNLMAFIAALFLTFSFFIELKAQANFVLTNTICADVEIGYEIDDGPAVPSGCGVCTWGTKTIFAGQTVNLSNCGGTGFNRICIWINTIDGVAVGAGNDCHNDCHPLGPQCCFQTCGGGNIPAASSCSPGAPYVVTVVPGVSWTIQ